MSDASREAFEKWAKSRFGAHRVNYIDGCGYDLEQVDYAWEGYEAARAQQEAPATEHIGDANDMIAATHQPVGYTPKYKPEIDHRGKVTGQNWVNAEDAPPIAPDYPDALKAARLAFDTSLHHCVGVDLEDTKMNALRMAIEAYQRSEPKREIVDEHTATPRKPTLDLLIRVRDLIVTTDIAIASGLLDDMIAWFRRNPKPISSAITSDHPAAKPLGFAHVEGVRHLSPEESDNLIKPFRCEECGCSVNFHAPSCGQKAPSNEPKAPSSSPSDNRRRG